MNIAAIPVKNKLEWTAPLVEHLLLHDEVDRVWIFDNGSTDQTHEWVENRRRLDQRLQIYIRNNVCLYDIWNEAVQMANDFPSSNLAVLNNDIRLPPYAIRDMSLLMRKEGYQIAAVDPSRTGLYSFSIGWWSPKRALPKPIDPYCEEQGFGFRVGWAFVLAAEFWKDQPYAVDPRFEFYFGDDDLYCRAMDRDGRSCIVRGIGSDHAESQSGEVNKETWLKDEALFKELWHAS